MLFWNFLVFFLVLTDVGNLVFGFFALSKSTLNIWEFLVHVLLDPSLENFEHYFASVWDECNCAVLWTFFGIAFLWDWNENWPCPVLWPLPSFPNCWHIEYSTFTASSFRTWNSSAGIPSPLLTLFTVRVERKMRWPQDLRNEGVIKRGILEGKRFLVLKQRSDEIKRLM